MKLSVIIPVYNETRSVEAILERVRRVALEKEVIVVDDGSTDGTCEKLKRVPDIVLVVHERNQGKGAALKSGLARARGDVVIFQDADLEYDPADFGLLFAKIRDGVKIVYGSRFLGKGDFLLASRLANRFLTFLTNLLFGSHLTDMETCYKMLHRSVFGLLSLRARRFDFEPEVTAQLLRQHCAIVEVPIHYRARRAGKKIGVKDGLAAVLTLLKYRLL